MAALSEILTNPAYVNANAETKRAIFEKHAPTDTNYSGANDATKQAIRAKFGIEDAPVAPPATAAPETPAGQIPVDPRLKAPAALPQSVSKGKRLADIARPTVEALGSVAGGALGTPLGPLGMVGGAGLGYGAAKTGMDMIEQLMGTKRAPSSMGEGLVQGAGDVLTGASMDAGGRAAAPILAGVAGKVMDLGSLGKLRAAKTAKDALTKDSPRGVQDAVSALRGAAGQDVNAAQATAGMNSPTWQALMERAGSRNPAAQTAMAARQDAESVKALARAAGGKTATSNIMSRGASKTALNNVTTPMRDAALSVPPVDVKSVVGDVRKIALRPEFAGDDVVEGAMKNIAEDMSRHMDKTAGTIDPVALDAIRKNSINAAIAKLRANVDASAQKKLASKVMSEVKPLIDDAMGDPYKAYLKTHSEGMQKIAEKKLMGEGLDLWKTNKDGFVKLVQGESPEVVEKVLGPGKFNIAQDLANQHMTVLREQAVKALRDRTVKEQATKGQEALRNLLIDDLPNWRLPSYLNVFTSTANKSIAMLENKLGKSTMNNLAKASESPEAARKLLETLPAAERSRVLNILRNPQSWSPGASAMVRGGATGAAALTDQSSKE